MPIKKTGTGTVKTNVTPTTEPTVIKMPSKPMPESISMPHITINQPILTDEQLQVLSKKLSPQQFALLKAQLSDAKNKELTEKRKKTSCHCGQTIRDVKKNIYYTLIWNGKGTHKLQNIEINVQDISTGELFNTDTVKDSSCISFEEMAKLMKCKDVEEFTQNFVDNHSKKFEIL